MSKRLQISNIVILLSLLVLAGSTARGQSSFDNATRGVFIFDLSQYVDYGSGFSDTTLFRIGIVDDTTDLFFELGRLRNQRPEIQSRPVHILLFRNEEAIRYTEVLYVNAAKGFSIDRIRSAIGGRKSLLLTEGYPFRQSMINFVVTPEGKLRFEANEEMISGAGLSVNPNILFQAVKTREEWEDLFNKASEEIEVQKREIEEQGRLLDSLDSEVRIREADLILKEKILGQQMARIDSQIRIINEQMAEIGTQKQMIGRQDLLIDSQQADVTRQRDTLEVQKRNISRQIEMIDTQLQQIVSQDRQIKVQLEAIGKQRMMLWFSIIFIALLGTVVYYIFRGYRIKKEANRELQQKNETISGQRDEMEMQRDQIAYQKKHITDSIMYARRIQTALLPSMELFSDRIEHFVLYKPLDIVSGDFYWVSSKGSKQVVIVADCTGHGVPGAFLSMLGVTMLNEIVNARGITEPDMILNEMREFIINSLKQSIEEDRVKDGLDMVVSVIDFESMEMMFAGANLPLILIRGDELMQFRGDKMPVSIHYRMQPFNRQTITLRKGDMVYLFTDGYCDQFGGPDKKKFMTARLKQELMSLSHMPMMEQGERLNKIFEEWKGGNSQVDDVAMIGLRI